MDRLEFHIELVPETKKDFLTKRQLEKIEQYSFTILRTIFPSFELSFIYVFKKTKNYVLVFSLEKQHEEGFQQFFKRGFKTRIFRQYRIELKMLNI